MDRFRIEGSRLEGYMIVDTTSGRRIGKKGGHGQPYKLLSAAQKRRSLLENRYREATTPRQPYASPAGINKWDQEIPKPVVAVLPDELFQFE